MNLLYNNKRNLLIFIILIIQIAYLITEYFITAHQFGVPLDDGWIHFRFAENMAAGKFFQYNIGELTPGTTSPLWSVMMSIPFFF